MPTVEVVRDDLFARLGKKMTQEEFQELCFAFGIELDDVTSEYEKMDKNLDKDMSKKERQKILKECSKEVLYAIDIPANRYDLLGLEGLSNGLNIFLGQKPPQVFKPSPPQYTMRVTKNTTQVRPYVVCAVLRGFKMDENVYNRLIELQDKLHFNICRKRTLVAIGTHDLDKMTPPFLYDARKPSDIFFRALKEEQEMTAQDLVKTYLSRKDKLCSVRKYVHIIQKSPVYPIIYDQAGQVLSFPPIINSEYSKMSVNTKNLFIECTATDRTKAMIVLHTLIAGFAEYCDVVEQVKVEYDDRPQDNQITPTFKTEDFQTSVKYINSNLGTNFSAKEIQQLLKKMSLDCTANGKGELKVSAPVTRSDILHPVDIVEDVAIAFDYNKITKRLPPEMTIAAQQPLNKLTDAIRLNMAMCGFSEVLNWALGPKEDAYEKMNLPDRGVAVELSKPKFEAFEMVRVNLLPGCLNTIQANQSCPLPIQIFEVSDVMLLCDTKVAAVGARNERRLCAVTCTNKRGGFELIHGLLERVMELNQVSFEHAKNRRYKRVYRLGKGDSPTFLPGMQAKVLLERQGSWECVGNFGIVHPTVMKKFGISIQAMCYALEINIEVFL